MVLFLLIEKTTVWPEFQPKTKMQEIISYFVLISNSG
jgi:hypothetical protein